MSLCILIMGVYSLLFFGFFISYILPKIRGYTHFCNFHTLSGRYQTWFVTARTVDQELFTTGIPGEWDPEGVPEPGRVHQ